MRDHYEVLGVSKSANSSEIKHAYRQKAKQHHPDLGGSEEEIKKVNLAWEVLGDPIKKQSYDLQQSPSKEWSTSSQTQASSWSNWRNSAANAQPGQSNSNRHSSSRTTSREGSSKSYESVGKTTFRKICTCGCRGYPMTHVSWTIDFNRYSTCPARRLRKRCGFYYSDSGTYVSWNPAKTARWTRRNEARRNPEAAKKAKRAKDKARREAAKAEREAFKMQEEEARIRNREVPLSPAEARRRGLTYYKGGPCKYGHDSLRDLKSNCLRCRELEKLRRAAEKLSR